MKAKKSMKNKKEKKKGQIVSAKKSQSDNKSLKEIYKSNLDYIFQCRYFILISLGIFLFFFLLGLFVPTPEFIEKEIFDLLRELSEKISGIHGIQLIFYIFFNNLFASLFGLILGIFFGIFSVTSSITNGYILGFVSALSVSVGGISSLWKLLPHGIFELPAIFISLGMGLSLGFPFVYRYFKYHSHKKENLAILFGILFLLPAIIITALIDKKLRAYQTRDFKRRLNSSLSVFFFVIVPLLILAAVIEGLLITFL